MTGFIFHRFVRFILHRIYRDPRPSNFAVLHRKGGAGPGAHGRQRFALPLGSAGSSYIVRSSSGSPAPSPPSLFPSAADPLRSEVSATPVNSEDPTSSASFGCRPQLSRSVQKNTSSYVSQLGAIRSATSGQQPRRRSRIRTNSSRISR